MSYGWCKYQRTSLTLLCLLLYSTPAPFADINKLKELEGNECYYCQYSSEHNCEITVGECNEVRLKGSVISSVRHIGGIVVKTPCSGQEMPRWNVTLLEKLVNF